MSGFIEAPAARRAFMQALAAAGAVAASQIPLIGAEEHEKGKANAEAEVTANEDLMREHGVIRRALIVYHEMAARLRAGNTKFDVGALNEAAKLFRNFGEEYHEKKLEETYIFPAVKKKGGELARYADLLTAQHKRGREITNYIISVTGSGKISDHTPFANALDSMFRMYEAHAAREDTIIFPAWKKTMNAKQYDEIGDKFEEIEHQTFGKDGFDDAEARITKVEATLGLSDLAQFTAPPPPKA